MIIEENALSHVLTSPFSLQESSLITSALVNFGAVKASLMTSEYSSVTLPTRGRRSQEAWL